jgi:hypothetical protein
MLTRARRRGLFRVVVLESGGHRRVVARSSSFRVPRVRAIPNRGKPRAEHERLVAELVGSGWRRVQTNGRWHDTAFTRPAPDPPVRRVRDRMA